jgi:hypothetical protein
MMRDWFSPRRTIAPGAWRRLFFTTLAIVLLEYLFFGRLIFGTGGLIAFGFYAVMMALAVWQAHRNARPRKNV